MTTVKKAVAKVAPAAETKAAPTATVKAEVKPATVKAEKPKTETEAKAKTTKTTKTTKAKKTTTRKTTKKAELKVTMNVQFGGKSYTTDDLVKIAKDVWKYDLKQKAGDFKSVELYVKPEDGMAYFVINGKEAGSFYI